MTVAQLKSLMDRAAVWDEPEDPVGQVVPPELRLKWEFANASDELQPPDELVEEMLTRGGSSITYGDSNTGKTYVAIDVAANVAQGTRWMGRRTHQGLVIYLATESPTSVRMRLRAYQKHFGVVLPLFAVVNSPVDLFASDADSEAVVALVKEIEQQRQCKCELIVGDTLARIAAGANENAGDDMGLVIRRVDAIRNATGAHFMLIHHSGKDVARGARGWSGIRAAVDTELEITADEASGIRTIEVTKQRDLPGKNDRIGFRLVPVQLGMTKWLAPWTSCVVEAAEAPPKKGKKLGEIAGAILELLTTKKAGMRKAEVVAHFEGRYDRGPVYREIKKLKERQLVLEAAGMVSAKVNP